MPAKLPLTLKVRSVRRSPEALEVDAVVTDASGMSVSYEPITMGPATTTSGVCAALQNHVRCLADTMHKRGAAEAPPPTEEDDAELVGREFTGSVVT